MSGCYRAGQGRVMAVSGGAVAIPGRVAAVSGCAVAIPGRVAAVLMVAWLTGCATVPQNRRAHFADPMMSLTREPLDAARRQKMYDSREGAAGGDGATAGGGCGCQ